jgi:hypothetical protein
MRVGEVATAPGGRAGSMREGVLEQKFLLMGQDNSPNNYLLNVGRTGGGGWTTPVIVTRSIRSVMCSRDAIRSPKAS